MVLRFTCTPVDREGVGIMETEADAAAEYLRRIEREAKSMHRARQRAALAADELAASVKSALLRGWVSESEAARVTGVSRTTIRQWRAR